MKQNFSVDLSDFSFEFQGECLRVYSFNKSIYEEINITFHSFSEFLTYCERYEVMEREFILNLMSQD